MAGVRSSALDRGIRRAREVRTQPYWDHQVVTATTDVSFFTTVQALARDGNLQTAGQLPAPRQFLVKGLSVYATQVSATTALVDIAIVANSCFIFSISDKEYLRFLGWMAPGAGGLESLGTALTTQSMVRNGQALAYNYFKVAPAILIPLQQNFKIVMTSISAAPAAATNVTVVIWGTEERAVQ